MTKKTCGSCGGAGTFSAACISCDGRRFFTGYGGRARNCGTCGGSGKQRQVCPTCKGRGTN